MGISQILNWEDLSLPSFPLSSSPFYFRDLTETKKVHFVKLWIIHSSVNHSSFHQEEIDKICRTMGYYFWVPLESLSKLHLTLRSKKPWARSAGGDHFRHSSALKPSLSFATFSFVCVWKATRYLEQRKALMIQFSHPKSIQESKSSWWYVTAPCAILPS